jgi:hypothetical protein
MPIVKYRRILVLSLCLSTGASAQAQGPPERRVSDRAGTASPGFLETVQRLWGDILGLPWIPLPLPPPGGDGPTRHEGPGVCPHGHM